MIQNTKNIKYSFICCIEAGRLEYQTCLMILTFRKNSGTNLSNSPIYVISGRSGPKISNETLLFLENLNATYIKAHEYNPKPWFNYSNKIAAVNWAQNNLNTEYIAWLDSDILIAGDFTENLPFHIIDFAGRCEKHAPVVSYNEKNHFKYWEKVCELIKYDFNSMPWIDIDQDQKKRKPYINSGFFIWRKETNFAKLYINTFIKLLESKYATKDGGAWFADQVIITPIIYSENLKWHHLELENHHMIFQDHIDGQDPSPSMNNSKLIHYSKSLTHPYKKRLMERLFNELPFVHEQIIDFDNKFQFKNNNFQYSPIFYIRKIMQKIFILTCKKIHD